MTRDVNGAWLALGVAGAAAAGAALGRKGSRASLRGRLASLTDDQVEDLRLLEAGHQEQAKTAQERLARSGVDLSLASGALEQIWRRQTAFVDASLPRAGGTGADWSTPAWSVDANDPKEGYHGERFLVLDPDRSSKPWVLVRRQDSEEGDEIEEVKRFSFEALKTWLKARSGSASTDAVKLAVRTTKPVRRGGGSDMYPIWVSKTIQAIRRTFFKQNGRAMTEDETDRIDDFIDWGG